MIRSFVLLAVLPTAAALAACQQEQPAPSPATAETLEITEDLVMPPEEAEVPPAVGQEDAAPPPPQG